MLTARGSSSMNIWSSLSARCKVYFTLIPTDVELRWRWPFLNEVLLSFDRCFAGALHFFDASPAVHLRTDDNPWCEKRDLWSWGLGWDLPNLSKSAFNLEPIAVSACLWSYRFCNWGAAVWRMGSVLTQHKFWCSFDNVSLNHFLPVILIGNVSYIYDMSL